MKHTLRAVICVGLLVGSCVAANASTGDVRALLRERGFAGEWIVSFGTQWDVLQTRLGLPADTVETVVRLLKPEWVPADPVEAAKAIHDTVRQAETERRRGEPLWRIATRLDHELRQGGQGVAGAVRRLGADASRGQGRLEAWRGARAEAARGPSSRPPAAGQGQQGTGGGENAGPGSGGSGGEAGGSTGTANPQDGGQGSGNGGGSAGASGEGGGTGGGTPVSSGTAAGG